jgi:LacI family transcriptional regulator
LEGVPTVWLDRDPATLPPGALCVMQDARSVGTVAAKELLRYDLASYAFVDRADAPFWSKGRREAFKEAVELNRSPYFEFCEKGASSWTKRLSGFIRSLSRPAGLFCANDTVAADVISVASRAGIAIPEELLVVGVDDVEAYCEALSPTLTSVRPSFAEEGRGAADLLAKRLANPRLKGIVKTFSAHEITLRQSTRRISAKGGNIAAALEMIRRRAADGVTVGEVVKLMGCSRRSAEIRFKQYLHSSILDEIHSARIELAKKLISDGGAHISGLHLRSGFSSPATFRRVFKSFTGVSPQDYQKKV